MNKKYKLGHTKEMNEDGSVRFRFTEKMVDRYGDVVEPKGIILDNYKKNPVVLWSHGYEGNMTIGKTLIDTFEITDKFVDANIVFDETSGDEFSKIVANKVKSGFLNAVSIGFDPITISEKGTMEGQYGYTFLEWELLEISVCSIPANPNALITNEYSEYREDVIKKFGKEKAEGIFKRDFEYLITDDKETQKQTGLSEVELKQALELIGLAKENNISIDEMVKHIHKKRESDNRIQKISDAYDYLRAESEMFKNYMKIR